MRKSDERIWERSEMCDRCSKTDQFATSVEDEKVCESCLNEGVADAAPLTLSEIGKELQKRAQEQMEIAARLIQDGVPPIQAMVVSGDILSGERMTELVEKGEDPLDLVWLVGSYARFDWAKKHLKQEDFERMLIDLWRDSDPNDQIEILQFWKNQKDRVGKVLTDGDDLPDAHTFVVYRGQADGPLGVSWSFDEAVAMRFARTGGGRAPISDGVVFTGLVKREDVIAYITERGEKEIIVDPEAVSIVTRSRYFTK